MVRVKKTLIGQEIADFGAANMEQWEKNFKDLNERIDDVDRCVREAGNNLDVLANCARQGIVLAEDDTADPKRALDEFTRNFWDTRVEPRRIGDPDF